MIIHSGGWAEHMQQVAMMLDSPGSRHTQRSVWLDGGGGGGGENSGGEGAGGGGGCGGGGGGGGGCTVSGVPLGWWAAIWWAVGGITYWGGCSSSVGTTLPSSGLIG